MIAAFTSLRTTAEIKSIDALIRAKDGVAALLVPPAYKVSQFDTVITVNWR